MENIKIKRCVNIKWQVNQTSDGYNRTDAPALAEFDDYEEAVKFLYTGNEHNKKKLAIDSVES